MNIGSSPPSRLEESPSVGGSQRFEHPQGSEAGVISEENDTLPPHSFVVVED